MNQMELYQIFVFTKWRLLILFLLLLYLISLSSKLFCEGNEPNGVMSNINFNKVQAFHPFIADTQSENIFFKSIFMKANEPNRVESNICFYKVEAFYPFITAT
jgi:hypothetical protein